MNESDRLNYLKTMGIQVWMPRMAESEYTRTDMVVDDRAPSEDKDAETCLSDSSDVNHLDWGALETTVSTCQACELHKTRTQTVFGIGNRQAKWMIIGEAPGADEDRQGEPFVGRAGQLLTVMLQALGLKREDVYIANILKCRPPNNRDPLPEEVIKCEVYLHRQVELIQPEIILAAGRVAAQNLLKTDTPVGKMRQRQYEYADTGIPVVITYHPAYLLRSPGEKRKAWADLCFARDILQGSQP